MRAPLAAALLLPLALLASCARSPVPTAPAPAADTGLDRLERLTLTANRCWIRSGDPLFASFSLAPELSSFSGRPRFLLVPRGRPEERPLLVVEGRSDSPAVDTYGPLMAGPAAGRIRTDMARWSAGSDSCSA